jgi:hypothetical protein
MRLSTTAGGSARPFLRLVSYVVCSVAFVWMGLRILPDYGINWDERDYFYVGFRYLEFLTTFDDKWIDFSQDPVKESYPDYARFAGAISSPRSWDYHGQGPWVVPPMASLLSATSHRILTQRLGCMDDIPGAHAINSILVLGLCVTILWLLPGWHGRPVAMAAVLLLLGQPRFFGEVWSNTRDVPETVFYAAFMLFFARWLSTRRDSALALAATAAGLSLGCKPNIVVGVASLALWYGAMSARRLRQNPPVRLFTVLRLLFAAGASVLLFVMSFPQFYSVRSLVSKDAFLFLASHVAHFLVVGRTHGEWNLYSLSQLLVGTPPLVLIFAVIGIWRVLAQCRKEMEPDQAIGLLWLVWLLVPMLRLCFPGAAYYDGFRHFLVVLVPLSILAALGLDAGHRWLENHVSSLRLGAVGRSIVRASSLVVVGLALVPGLVTTHPFQTTYFNCFVGGLGGAQRLKIPFACDYYALSYKQALDWLNRHAPPGASIATFPNRSLAEVYPRRHDLMLVKPEHANDYSCLPSASYVIAVPRREWLNARQQPESLRVLEQIREYPLVHEVRRQGGVIVEIRQAP